MIVNPQSTAAATGRQALGDFDHRQSAHEVRVVFWRLVEEWMAPRTACAQHLPAPNCRCRLKISIQTNSECRPNLILTARACCAGSR